MFNKTAPYRQTNLGIVAAGKRNIKSGHQYNQYFQLGGLQFTDPIITNGTTFRTLQEMEKVVKSTLSHTKTIAHKLKGATIGSSLNNLYHFIYQHIQYTPDKEGVEQIRTPLRTWHDRGSGVDCDCFSVFISSVLHNWKIAHAFRMSDYGQGWQHVYVVVPHNGNKSALDNRSGYTVIDPVLDQFNYEKPFHKKYDHFMQRTPIQVLNGVGACLPKATYTNIYRPEWISLSEIEDQGNVVTEQLLKELGLSVENSYTPEGKPLVKTEINGNQTAFETIISQKQANEIKAMATQLSTALTTSESGFSSTKGLGKIALLVLAGFGVMYAIRPTNSSKGGGLGSVKTKNTKRKTAKKAIKAKIVKLK